MWLLLSVASVVYVPYSAHMSPDTTHKLMGFYMEGLILGIIHVL